MSRIDDPTAVYSRDPISASLEIIPDTKIDASFVRISSWLTECSNHYRVCELDDEEFMPHRVLNVCGYDPRGRIKLLG